MNIAQLAKQAWRIIQDPQSYWASTLKSIYFPNSDFWNAKDSVSSFWVWKSILHGRQVLKELGRWALGPGSNVNVIEEHWLASGNKAVLKETASITKVSEVITDNHQWNIPLLRDDFSPVSAVEALQTPISWTFSQDHLYWPFSNDDTYSIKPGYGRLVDLSPAPFGLLYSSLISLGADLEGKSSWEN